MNDLTKLWNVLGKVYHVDATNRVHAIATYDDFTVKVYVPDYPKDKKLTGMELIGEAKKIKKLKKQAKQNESNESTIERSRRRAKKQLTGYIHCNTFELYVTFTFKKHRDDINKCRKQMETWLDNEKKKERRGNFDYIIVAELHDDGAIHFHALFKDYKGKVVPSINPKTGKHLRKKGRLVYDLPSYTLGHVYVNKIDDSSEDRQKLTNYLSKYLTKEMPLFPGRKRYWVSTGLTRPVKEYNPDDQKDALPAQIYRLQDYAEREFDSSELVQFQESAFKEGRKQFAEIVARIQAEQEIVAVAFDKIDRFSRDSSADETRVLRKLCHAGKIEIHFISDHLQLTAKSSANEWFMLGIGETTAEHYSRIVSDNVRRRFEQMRRDGLWTGKAPFGYANVDQPDGKKWIEPDKFEAEVVEFMYKEYATGVSSLKLIRKHVKAEFGIKIATAQIYRVLTNHFYKGEMRVEGKLYPHKYEPIITEKLFGKVGAVREGYNIKPAIYAGLPYPYRGLITCADCGRRITFEIKKGKYIYGHFTQTGGKHGASYVNENELTKQLKATIKRIHIPEQAYLEVSQKLKALKKQDSNKHSGKLATLNAEIKKYELRIDNMYDDKVDGNISPDFYEKKRQEYEAKIKTLTKRRNKIELMAKDNLSTIAHLLKLARQAPKLFEKGKIERKRALIKLIHSNLELAGKELRSTLRFPFDKIAECNETGNWLSIVDKVRTKIIIGSSVS
jgi:DNA invertase Pin-like site-specific DNA recombinase